jgi:hypothetical protein
MAEQQRSDFKKWLEKLVGLFSGLPWIEIIGDVWKLGRQMLQSSGNAGLFEVLEYESTLELKDRQGEMATFKKREKVRYLKDNVIAYQDQAWGDGEILVDYRCTPGVPVDQYRSGHKTYILISRREVKNKGETDEFNIQWRMKRGFLRQTEQWETNVRHPTKELVVIVIFPKSRPPRQATLIESTRQRSHSLEKKETTLLPDGRTKITWEKSKPRLHETYIIQWEW